MLCFMCFRLLVLSNALLYLCVCALVLQSLLCVLRCYVVSVCLYG